METKSKFQLAEALLLDIPPRKATKGWEVRRGEAKSVEQLLKEAREAIIANGGEAKSYYTLLSYRLVAIWVQQQDGSFGWVDGYSFTAHYYAHNSGISYEEWAANPVSSAETRHKNGYNYSWIHTGELSKIVDAEIARRESLKAEEAERIQALMPVRQKLAQAKREAAAAFKAHADWREAMIVNSGDKAKPANQQLQFWANNVVKLIDSHDENGYYYTNETIAALRDLSLRIENALCEQV